MPTEASSSFQLQEVKVPGNITSLIWGDAWQIAVNAPEGPCLLRSDLTRVWYHKKKGSRSILLPVEKNGDIKQQEEKAISLSDRLLMLELPVRATKKPAW